MDMPLHKYRTRNTRTLLIPTACHLLPPGKAFAFLHTARPDILRLYRSTYEFLIIWLNQFQKIVFSKIPDCCLSTFKSFTMFTVTNLFFSHIRIKSGNGIITAHQVTTIFIKVAWLYSNNPSPFIWTSI